MKRILLFVVVGVVVIGLGVAGYFLVDFLSQPEYGGPKKGGAAATPNLVVTQQQRA